MAAYRQEVRKFEEKFDGFELHHILWWDNEAADALMRLGSSHEKPPPGVFIQDLIKSSNWLDEDSPTPAPGTPSGKGSTTPAPGTPPGKGGPTPALDINPGTPPRPMGQAREPRLKMVAVIESSGFDPD
jgi:hypothetical protein